MPTDPLFELIAATFADLGAGDAPIIRTLLLRDRYFVGHCYRCGDFHAVWKPDSTAIEFFGPEWQLVRAISLPNQEKRDAA
jgi:hypothetical protein